MDTENIRLSAAEYDTLRNGNPVTVMRGDRAIAIIPPTAQRAADNQQLSFLDNVDDVEDIAAHIQQNLNTMKGLIDVAGSGHN